MHETGSAGLEWCPRYGTRRCPVRYVDILRQPFKYHVLTRQLHDSPYRDAPSHSTASQPAARKPRQQQKSKTARPVRETAPPPRSAERTRRDAASAEKSSTSPARRRSRRSRRSGSPYASSAPLTSHPTGRAAYQETRGWLLDQHGPICAYCGDRFDPAVMTLDHVAPRRGQTAYDRRDNLVLACKECNAQKRDLAPTAFLLARRSRAVHLLRYGTHLSPMLVDLARSLIPADTDIEYRPAASPFIRDLTNRESPYLD